MGYSRVQWVEWIEQQPGTGLSVAEFCDAVGVSTNSFYRWRAKLSQAQVDSNVSAQFVPLTLVGSTSVEIEFPCGAVMRVPSENVVLRQVLEILLEAGATETGAFE
ncbi:IS66 family insertion sequence element accessory protein TnpA [Thalassoglobus neptunius]|uniref:IS66 family insertion sequence element accessory protein TnpA n=1 Tax=Thalassoglobus neptunius TaxID=1938619 RepID=UPI0018D23D17|nr:transposase [Thalassoglobus neptunius]